MQNLAHAGDLRRRFSGHAGVMAGDKNIDIAADRLRGGNGFMGGVV